MEDTNVNGMRCETVTVVGQDGGPLIINKSDFDVAPGKWTLIDAAPIEYDVKKDGKRYYAIDKATGEVKFDAAGYASDVEAWTAVTNAG